MSNNNNYNNRNNGDTSVEGFLRELHVIPEAERQRWYRQRARDIHPDRRRDDGAAMQNLNKALELAKEPALYEEYVNDSVDPNTEDDDDHAANQAYQDQDIGSLMAGVRLSEQFVKLLASSEAEWGSVQGGLFKTRTLWEQSREQLEGTVASLSSKLDTTKTGSTTKEPPAPSFPCPSCQIAFPRVYLLEAHLHADHDTYEAFLSGPAGGGGRKKLSAAMSLDDRVKAALKQTEARLPSRETQATLTKWERLRREEPITCPWKGYGPRPLQPPSSSSAPSLPLPPILDPIVTVDVSLLSGNMEDKNTHNTAVPVAPGSRVPLLQATRGVFIPPNFPNPEIFVEEPPVGRSNKVCSTGCGQSSWIFNLYTCLWCGGPTCESCSFYRRLPRFGFVACPVRVCSTCFPGVLEWEADHLLPLATSPTEIRAMGTLLPGLPRHVWRQRCGERNTPHLRLECLAQSREDDVNIWFGSIQRLAEDADLAAACSRVELVAQGFPQATNWPSLARLLPPVMAACVHRAITLPPASLVEEIMYFCDKQGASEAVVVDELLNKLAVTPAPECLSLDLELYLNREIGYRIMHCCDASGKDWLQVWDKTVRRTLSPGAPSPVLRWWMTYVLAGNLPPWQKLLSQGHVDVALCLLTASVQGLSSSSSSSSSSSKDLVDVCLLHATVLLSFGDVPAAKYCLLLAEECPRQTPSPDAMFMYFLTRRHLADDDIWMTIACDLVQVQPPPLDLVQRCVSLDVMSRHFASGPAPSMMTHTEAQLWLALGEEDNENRGEYALIALRRAPTPLSPFIVMLAATALVTHHPAVAMELLRALHSCGHVAKHAKDSAFVRDFHLAVAGCLTAEPEPDPFHLREALERAKAASPDMFPSEAAKFLGTVQQFLNKAVQEDDSHDSDVAPLVHLLRMGSTDIALQMLLAWAAQHKRTLLLVASSTLDKALGSKHPVARFARFLCGQAGVPALIDLLLHDRCGPSVEAAISQALASPAVRGTVAKGVVEGLTALCAFLASSGGGDGLVPAPFLADSEVSLRLTPLATTTQFQQWFSRRGALRALALSERSILRSYMRAHEPLVLALQYLDLVSVAGEVSPLCVCGCFLHAAHAFLQAMQNADNNRSRFALKTALTECLWIANSAFASRLSPSVRVYVARYSLSLMVRVCAQAADRLLLTPRDGELICVCADRIASLVAVAPALYLPNTHACDLLFVQIRMEECASHMLQHIAQNDPILPPEQLMYWLHEEQWFNYFREKRINNNNNNSDDDDNDDKNKDEQAKQRISDGRFVSCRELCMQQLLSSHGWSSGHVEAVVGSPHLHRDEYGFIDHRRLGTLGGGLGLEFHAVHGFTLDLNTGWLDLMLEKAARDKPALFGWADVAQIFGKGLTHAIFTLDHPPSEDLSVEPWAAHPFHRVGFAPAAMRGTDLAHTLLDADYLLKFFTAGVEVSGAAPFARRAISEGLFDGIPAHLHPILAMPPPPGATAKAHRFWIAAGEIPSKTEIAKETIKVTFGYVPMSIKTQLLRRTDRGELEDAPVAEQDDDSHEAKFARTFTEHYDDIGRAIPLFARVRQLHKLVAACQQVRGYTAPFVDLVAHGLSQKKRLKMTSTFEKILQGLQEQVGVWPKADHQPTITRHYDDLVDTNARHNNVSRSRIVSSHGSELRSSVVSQLRDADNSAVDQIAKVLAEQVGCNRSDLTREVRSWLARGHSALGASLASTLASHSERKQIDQMRGVLDNLKRSGVCVQSVLDRSEGLSHALSLDSSCEWVPAAFHKKGHRLIYGGVSLQPQFRAVAAVNPPPHSSLRMSGAVLGAQRQAAAPYCDARRIDNMAAANKQFFENRTSANNAAVAAQKSHGSRFTSQKVIFKERIMNDPKQPRHIRGWYQQELNQGRSLRQARNPRGYDIDHTRDNADYMRMQYSIDNRTRGANSRRGGKWEGYENMRTRAQPPTNP
eukprot:TRINITY_DN1151_c0_g1_i2.p1 TRINITY_DN1151_c0_g1~~TRINITY_DN1151_c0_g1_i2.p1  ORF type:complete len:1946 (-),score=458.60 TRINITY_DN1151_c0_g1_i2:132-5969(-)